MTDLTNHDPLDGWCNFHQEIHEEDRGKDARPNRHNHLEPPRHKYQWFLDNPDCWAIVTPNPEVA